MTHIALGAVIGEGLVSKKIGRRGMLVGAIAQSIPDIDFLAGLWLDTDNNLLAHRGLTHSLTFVIIASFVCAFAARRWLRDAGISLWTWLALFVVEMLCHIFLDTMNSYGVGLFEPFFDHRYSFNVLFVADPFFSFAPGMAVILLMLMRVKHRLRRAVVFLGWGICAIYLNIAFFLKQRIESDIRREIGSLEVNKTRHFTTPTPMNILLWYIVIEDPPGYRIGYRSVFDHSPTRFSNFEKKNHALDSIAGREDVKNLIQFSNDYYVVEHRGDSLTFNDLRFGQVFGWIDQRAPFVFSYDLRYPDQNKVVIQRGRFKGWNGQNIRLTLKRIRGL